MNAHQRRIRYRAVVRQKERMRPYVEYLRKALGEALGHIIGRPPTEAQVRRQLPPDLDWVLESTPSEIEAGEWKFTAKVPPEPRQVVLNIQIGESDDRFEDTAIHRAFREIEDGEPGVDPCPQA